MHYLFNGKIQVGKNPKFYWGFGSPRKDSGDPNAYLHCFNFGWGYICW
jgi:hypothetical protein